MNIRRRVMSAQKPKSGLDLLALFQQVTGGPPSLRTSRSRMGRKLHFEILRREHRVFTHHTNYPSCFATLEALTEASNIPLQADPQFVPEAWLP